MPLFFSFFLVFVFAIKSIIAHFYFKLKFKPISSLSLYCWSLSFATYHHNSSSTAQTTPQSRYYWTFNSPKQNKKNFASVIQSKRRGQTRALCLVRPRHPTAWTPTGSSGPGWQCPGSGEGGGPSCPPCWWPGRSPPASTPGAATQQHDTGQPIVAVALRSTFRRTWEGQFAVWGGLVPRMIPHDKNTQYICVVSGTANS